MAKQQMDIAGPERWQTAHGEVQVTPELLRKMFNAPESSDIEIYQFMQLCRAQNLNPFLGEAYLIKYAKDQAASFVIGKETFTQRAEAHEDYDGMEAGIIVKRGDKVEYSTGAFMLKEDVLLGGWAKVYRKNWATPIASSVSLDEYDTGRSLWKSKPATMIRKVALVQALRESFPSSFAGLYDSSEVGQDLPQIQNVAVDKPAPTSLPAKTRSPSANGTPEPGQFANMGQFMAWAVKQGLESSSKVLAVARGLYPDEEIILPADIDAHKNDAELIDAVKGSAA